MTRPQTFLLPDLGEGLTEAEVVRWLVAGRRRGRRRPARRRGRDREVVVEVPSPFAGRVATLHGAEGETLAVGSAADHGRRVARRPRPRLTPRSEAYREEERAGSGNVLIGYGTAETRRGRGRRTRGHVARPPVPRCRRRPARRPARVVVAARAPPGPRRAASTCATSPATGRRRASSPARDVQARRRRCRAASPTPVAAAGADSERSPASAYAAQRVPQGGRRRAVAQPRARSPRPPSGSTSTPPSCWQLRAAAEAAARARCPGCWPTSRASSSPGCGSTPCSTPRSTPSGEEIVEYDRHQPRPRRADRARARRAGRARTPSR